MEDCAIGWNVRGKVQEINYLSAHEKKSFTSRQGIANFLNRRMENQALDLTTTRRGMEQDHPPSQYDTLLRCQSCIDARKKCLGVRFSGKNKCNFCGKRIPRITGAFTACTLGPASGYGDISLTTSTSSINKGFKCSVCNRSFHSDCARHNHEISQHNTTALQCRICKRVFQSKTRLRAHQRTHNSSSSNSPAYSKCSICSHIVQKRNMSLHMERFHRAKSHNPCTLCDKAFNTPRKLKRHESDYHHSLTFSCEVCGYKYKCRRSCWNHIHRYHKEITNGISDHINIESDNSTGPEGGSTVSESH